MNAPTLPAPSLSARAHESSERIRTLVRRARAIDLMSRTERDELLVDAVIALGSLGEVLDELAARSLPR